MNFSKKHFQTTTLGPKTMIEVVWMYFVAALNAVRKRVPHVQLTHKFGPQNFFLNFSKEHFQTTTLGPKTMVLGPKVVVWKCSFEKFKKKFCGPNLCVNCTWGTRFRTAFSAATKYIQTTSIMVLGPKVVVWKCSFQKFKKMFGGANSCVNWSCGTRFRTPFRDRKSVV